MNKNFKTLEFDKILKILSTHCISEMGRERVTQLRPKSSLNEIKNLQEETSQARFCFEITAKNPFNQLSNITDIIKKLKIQGLLYPSDLVVIMQLIISTKSCKSYISSTPLIKEKANRIYQVVNKMNSLVEAERKIISIIDEDGQIKDSASETLAKLRKTILSKQNALKAKANELLTSSSFRSYLQEPIITLRNNRYVFPIKAQYRSNVNGIVHDQSSSGITLYIEPLSLVQLQNEINNLASEEQLEISKILKEVSEALHEFTEEFQNNFEILIYLDEIFAKAKYSISIKGKRPILSETKIISLLDAKHPLISQEIAIPNDLKIDSFNKALIITGPNTGGKTVCLKTTGLLILMHQSGLQLPVSDGSELSCFSRVYADIGDEQSIQQSLSTFSSHITHIKGILESIDDSSLILFDELGSGTDPSEGASLAISILEFVLKKNAFVMATTHYNELKQYAYQTNEVQNASMDFDIKSLKPTYKINYGIAGQSNAFAISRQIGLNEEVIKSAENYNKNHSLESEILFKSLEIEKEKLLTEKLLYQQELDEYRKKIALFEEEKLFLEQKKSKIINSAKKEAQNIIEKAKTEIEIAIEEIKQLQKNANFESVVKAQTIKSTLINNNGHLLIKPQEIKNIQPVAKEDLKVGMKVYISNLDDEGIITEYQKNAKEAYVEIGLIKINVPIKNLFYPNKKNKVKDSHLSSRKTIKINSAKSEKTKTISTSIDLRGMMVEEALLLLDKYIDDAYLSSLSEISIIHGKGTGALRIAVTNYLKKHNHVLSYRFGTYHEGGNGNTIVTLK